MEQVILLSIPIEELKILVQEAVRAEIQSAKADVNKPEFLTIKEACQILCSSRASLHNWSKMGLIPKHRIHGVVRYKYTDVMDAVKKIKRFERRPTSWKEV